MLTWQYFLPHIYTALHCFPNTSHPLLHLVSVTAWWIMTFYREEIDLEQMSLLEKLIQPMRERESSNWPVCFPSCPILCLNTSSTSITRTQTSMSRAHCMMLQGYQQTDSLPDELSTQWPEQRLLVNEDTFCVIRTQQTKNEAVSEDL